MSNAKITWPAPIFKSLALDESHYCYVDNSAFNLGTGDFGLDALLYIDSTITDAEGWICAKGVSNLANVSGWHLVVDKANRKIGLRVNDGDVAPTLVYSDAAAFAFDTWFWLAVRADRDGSAYFYVNGVAVGSGSIAAAAGSLNNAEYFKVGAYDAATTRLKGYIGMLRVDVGRLLPVSWVTQEWDRLRYGLPRKPEDFTALWLFGDRLIDESGTYTLIYTPVVTPTYATGYPSGTLTYTFTKNYRYEPENHFLDTDTNMRAADGTGRSYAAPFTKRTFVAEFPPVEFTQKTAIEGAWASKNLVNFYADATLPRTLQGRFVVAPGFREILTGYYVGSIELEEA